MKQIYTYFNLTFFTLLIWHTTPTLSAQNVIGGSSGDPAAILDLQSTSKGLLLPRMTSAERSAISNPPAGLMIYNTTLGCMELNIGTSSNPDWGCMALAGKVGVLDCTNTTYIGAIIPGYSVEGVSFSVHYTNGNGGPHSGQVVSSTGVTGLTATLSPGTFTSGSGTLTYTVTGTASGVGTASFALVIGGQTCTITRTIKECGAYIASGVWKEFLCHNLGADTSAYPTSPSWKLIGNYYQWGRNPSCFGKDGVDATNYCTSPIYGAAGPTGTSTQNDNAGAITGWETNLAPVTAWLDASKTANDPCPSGYRVPTKAQWEGVADTTLNPQTTFGTWDYTTTTNYSAGKLFGSSLFLPAADSRSNGGTLYSRGYTAIYWASTVYTDNTRAYVFNAYQTVAFVTHLPRNIFATPIRCIKE